MSSGFTLLKRIGIGLAVTFLLLLATITTLVESTVGSRVALSIVSRLLPIEFVAPQGDLLSGLDMERIRYEKDGVLVDIINPSFRWRPASALLGTLHIESLKASTVLLHFPKNETPETDAPFNNWPALRLPVRVELEKMSVDSIVLVLGDADPIFWHKLSGTFSLGTFHLRYQDLTLTHDQYAVTLTGATLIEYPYTTDARAQFRIGEETPTGANYPAYPYIGRGVIKGDLKLLDVRARSESPVVMQLDGDVALVDAERNLQTVPSMNLTAQWESQTLPPTWWVPNQPQPITTAKLTATGTWKHFSAKLLGNLHLDKYPKTHIEIVGTGTPEGMAFERVILTDDAVDIPLTMAAPLDPSASPVPFGAAINQKLPVATKTVKPAASVKKAPTVTHNPDAQRLELAGDVRWLPNLAWNLSTKGNKINFATFFPDFKSQLDFSFTSEGELFYGQDKWQVAVNELALQGMLRDQSLTAKGSGLGSSSVWKSPGLEVVYGPNQAAVKGELSDVSQVTWKLDTPELEKIWDGFSGSIRSQGQLLLKQSSPKMAMTLDAKDVRIGEYYANQLLVNLRPAGGAAPVADIRASESSQVALSRRNTQVATSTVNPVEELRNEITKALWNDDILKAENYSLSLLGNKLTFFGVALDDISVRGQGGWAKHIFDANISSPLFGHVIFSTQGEVDKDRWRGRFNTLDLRLPNVPRWWLVSSETITVANGDVSLGAQCLTTRGQAPRRTTGAASVTTLTGNADGDTLTSSAQGAPDNTPSEARLCTQGTLTRSKGLALSFDLSKAPIRQLYAAFNPDVTLTGAINGTGSLSSPWPISLASLKGDVKASTDNASVNYQYIGGEVKTYLWERTGLIASLRNGIVDAKGQVNWAGYGAFNAATKIDLKKSEFIDGRLNANFSNIAPLETFFVNVNELNGALSGSFNVKGKLASPVVSGEMVLQNGQASLLSLGIAPTNIGLTLRVENNDTVTLRGQATSNKGQLAVDARLSQLRSDTWAATGSIRGSDFRLLNTPQLRVHVSPNLFIGANRDAITIRGETLIPYARANIKTLPESAVKVSGDVVIVDIENLPQEQKAPWPVELNVKLDVGQDVKFTGFGLSSTLGGSLVLYQEKDWSRPLLNGYVSVVKGTYKAYGQSLNIDVGRLIFQGSYENPGLDIRASRDIAGDESVQVGLEITGTLQRPAAKVYSTPSMSDSEAMMMLLTGRPIKDASSAEATVLLGALTSLGDGGEGFTKGVAGILNVDEFGINANNGIDQSELWVGKYLTPKLLVRYVVGLFDQMVSLGVEYQINSRVRVEAKSGDEQSVDIIYKYER